jgi:hypothetical protein
MMMNMMDPSKFIMLYKLKPGKGIREAVLQQTTGFSGKEKESADKITFNLKKVEGKMFFVFIQKLQPGEYAFISMLNMNSANEFEVFCFQIE